MLKFSKNFLEECRFCKKLKRQAGAVYVLALSIMMLFFTMGAGLLFIARSEIRMNDNQLKVAKAFYFAEAGIERALAEIVWNNDEDGDGTIGSIGSGDLDLDADIDHSVTYQAPGTSVIGTLTATGTMGMAERTIVAEVTTSPWRGAMQAGGNINVIGSANGDPDGDVIARGSIISLSNLNVSDDDVSGNVITLVIPIPDLGIAGYMSVAGTALADCASFVSPFPPAGVYYINGDCSITLAGFNLNGALIVNGNLTLTGMSLLTITGTVVAGETIPPIIAAQAVTIDTIQNANIDGLIYAGTDFSLSNVIFSFDIDDGALVAGGNIVLNNVNGMGLTIDFDRELDPPYFSPNALPVRIDSWKGHW
ncbi:MAG TPA: hypothetical protein VI749_01445 [Candidatus Omnitrophota bacterium]|nr:hypothetical protein [Candidatus Omnitrophota bacterium]